MAELSVGVLRCVLHLSGDEATTTGNLWASLMLDEDEPPPEAMCVVLWTVDETRLRSMLDAVHAGEEPEDVMFALEACALAVPDDDDLL